jgi:pilus assembly protein CpaE
MAGENTSKILIVDDDPLTTAWLCALLEQEGYGVVVAQSGSEGLERIRADPPALVLLDVVLPDINGLGLCRRLRQTPEGASAWIIMLRVKGTREDIAAGLDAGADDYIPKRRGADAELLAKAKLMLSRPRIALAPPEETKHGRIISFFSAKGGSGTTTLAVNTAYALATFPPNASTLVVDMVFPLGAVGHMVGCESTETIAKLSHETQVALDRQAIAPYISPTKHFGFDVLLSAHDLQEAQTLEVSRIAPLFKTLRTMFDYIVVDFGRSLSRITLPILEISDLIYVIVVPDVTGVALAKLSLQYLFSRPIPRERIVVIQNRTVPRSWLSKGDIEQELGAPIAITIPYDGEQVPLTTNARVPYLERHVDSVTGVALRELERLTVERSIHPEKAPAARGT